MDSDSKLGGGGGGEREITHKHDYTKRETETDPPHTHTQKAHCRVHKITARLHLHYVCFPDLPNVDVLNLEVITLITASRIVLPNGT